MLLWFAKLISVLIIFSSFVFNVHASDDEFGDLNEFSGVGLNFSGSYITGSWSSNFSDILDDPLSSGLSLLPVADDHNPPSNTTPPKEPQDKYQEEEEEEKRDGRQMIPAEEEEEKAAPASPSGLTKCEEAEVRSNLNRKSTKNILIFDLLRTLKSAGVCEYGTLRDAVTSEGKKIYSLCGTCRDLGWIRSEGIGIWDITAKGLYALSLLGAKVFTEAPPRVKRARNKKLDEYDEYEEDPEEGNKSSRSQNYLHKPPRRTRSMNDLYEVENHPPTIAVLLPRPAELKKRRLAIDDQAHQEEIISNMPAQVGENQAVDQTPPPIVEVALEDVPPQFCWEQLSSKIRQHLIGRLENEAIPSVLANEQLMQGVMVGNFLGNLHREISVLFFTKYGIKIDHWLESYLRERIKILFMKSNLK